MREMSLQGLSCERRVHCPHCGEGFDALLDSSAGSQRYVEDCPVCCSPIVFELTVGLMGEVEDLVISREGD